MTYALDAPTQVLALPVSRTSVSTGRVRYRFDPILIVKELTLSWGSAYADLRTPAVDECTSKRPSRLAHAGNVVHEAVSSGHSNDRPRAIALVVCTLAGSDHGLDPGLV